MIRVKIPEIINIGGFDYPIVFQKPEKDDGGEAWGWFRNNPRILEISPESDDVRCSSTFIHECLHAIDNTILGDRLAEQDVKNLEAGLHQVLEYLGVRFVRDDKDNQD